MKKIIFLFLIAGVIGLVSCKKDETKVNLTDYTAAQILTPAQGSAYVLQEQLKDSVLFIVTWSPAKYSPSNLVKPIYTLEMDTIGNSFSDAKVLSTTSDYSFSITQGSMNTMILGAFSGKPDALAKFEMRVKAKLEGNNDQTIKISDVLGLSITPYSSEVVLSPIYLLGDATTVGWDNSNAREMKQFGSKGQFAIVETLLAGKNLKFIANLGAWAPQWGTDAAGTSSAGNLVYRPTESVPDPPAIPSPSTDGDYRILADTANLTYLIQHTSAQLFLIGDATTAGWDNTKGIPFVKEAPGVFSLTTTLTAGFIKCLEVSGQWAPQWGTDASGSSAFGNLVYRPDEATPDPPGIPSPGSGTYTIKLDLAQMKYKIMAK